MSNIFAKKGAETTLRDYMGKTDGRSNLGGELPVEIYRLFQFSVKEQLIRAYGEAAAVDVFRKAGYEAGVFFAENFLDISLPLSEFVSALQNKLEELKIGILRIERMDEDGHIVLTVSEDADCSGLPVLGKTVCNYDEGFLSGVLSTYTKKPYEAVEVDCWATGDRVCRFHADVRE